MRHGAKSRRRPRDPLPVVLDPRPAEAPFPLYANPLAIVLFGMACTCGFALLLGHILRAIVVVVVTIAVIIRTSK